MYSNVAIAEGREEAILMFVTQYKNENGYSPTYREICKHVGLKSTATVHMYVQRLISKGLLTALPVTPRTMGTSYEKAKAEHVMKIGNSDLAIPYCFNLSKEAIRILNEYCMMKNVSVDEAMEKSLSLLKCM